MKDETLSDKIITLEQIEKDQQLFIKAFGRKENTFVLFTEDVKEFIKKLKEHFGDAKNTSGMSSGRISINPKEYRDLIDKLAGEDLK